MRSDRISLGDGMFYTALVGILTIAVGHLAPPAFAETNTAQINSTICYDINVPLLRLNSKPAIEAFIED